MTGQYITARGYGNTRCYAPVRPGIDNAHPVYEGIRAVRVRLDTIVERPRWKDLQKKHPGVLPGDLFIVSSVCGDDRDRTDDLLTASNIHKRCNINVLCGHVMPSIFRAGLTDTHYYCQYRQQMSIMHVTGHTTVTWLRPLDL